ncbi:MAG: hypothetical protein H5T72_01870 [Actinobacteria bacterium]|nr:hypothetical protein [Actinomycetota bacterium]
MEINPSTLSARLIALENLIDKAKESLQNLHEKLGANIDEACRLFKEFTSLMKKVEEDYFSLCRVVREKAQELDIKSPHSFESSLPLPLLKELISAIERKMEKIKGASGAKSNILQVLEKATHINSLQPDEEIEDALENVRKLCGEVRDAVEKLLPDGIGELKKIEESVRNKEHPVSALVWFVDENRPADTDIEEKLFDIVKNEFGFKLAAAAIKGQLKSETPVRDTAQVMEDPEIVEAKEEETQAPQAEEAQAEPKVEAVPGCQESEEARPGNDGGAAQKVLVLEEEETAKRTPVIAEELKREEKPETQRIEIKVSPEKPIEEIAKEILESEDGRAERLLHAVLKTISEGRFALSYWLAKVAEEEGLEIAFPSWIPEVLEILPVFGGYSAEITEFLRDRYKHYNPGILDDEDNEKKQAMSILLFSTAIKPALVAPHIGASGMLRSLRNLPDSMYDLSLAVADCSDRGIVFHPDVISSVVDELQTQMRLKDIAERASGWLKEARDRKNIFQKAGSLWRYWFTPGKLLHGLLTPVAENDGRKAKEVQALIQSIEDEKSFQRIIENTLKEIRKTGKPIRIEAKALRQIKMHANEAVDIASEWLNLLRMEDSGKDQERVGTVRREWQKIKVLLDRALEDIRALDDSRSAWMAAAKKACVLMLEDLVDYLENGSYRPATGLLPLPFLRLPLLRMKGWPEGLPKPLDEDWVPPLSLLLKCLSEPLYGPEEAAARLMERGRFDLLAELVKVHEKVRLGSIVEPRSIQESKRAFRIRLSEEVSRVRQVVEEAVLVDAIDDVARSAFMQVLESLASEGVEDYESAFVRLREIEKKVEESKQRLKGDLEKRLEAIDNKDEEKTRIRNALDQSDFAVASELIEMLEKGETIEEASKLEREDYFEFFKNISKLEAILVDNEGSSHAAQRIADILRSKRQIGSIDLARLTSGNIRDAERLLNSWFFLKKGPGGETIAVLRDILLSAGFDAETIEPARIINKNARTYRLRTANVPVSPVHQFGSNADRSYQLLCLWERPAEKDILSYVKEYCRERPTIVFFFGRLSQFSRQELSRMTWEETTPPFIVVDDLVILYLCTVRGDKRAALFRSTLPLIGVNPFVPEARANVPPEIFFGREKEKASIIDPRGSSFIYGGRQFGKSALMKNVVRDFHDPESGRIAIYIDLKSRGIGHDRSINEIWDVLFDALRSNDVIPRAATKISNRDKIYEYVKRWLSEDRERRILLMLDEADEFLRQDAKGVQGQKGSEFVIVSALKGWQDEFEGRVKIVFAGLHSVQRFWRIPNQPLAHLGFPISIGPLNPGDAAKLINRPFKYAGFEFEDQNAVRRILSHTNYQPLLIQIYCDRLFRHMMKKRRSDEKSDLPPYVITSADVDAVYNEQDLRRLIKERFELTLQLDPWFELLSYIFAYKHVTGELDHRGLSDADVEMEARYWWEEGMKGADPDWVTGLLDEMIGLGLLVRDEAKRYRLRSPNVVRLLGSHEDIERVLLSFADRHPDFDRGPAINRRRLYDDPSRRSPLTLSQEANILEDRNSVLVIAGCVASGIDRLFDALNEVSFTGNKSRIVRQLSEVPAGEREFTNSLDLKNRNARPGLSIYLIPGSYLKGNLVEAALDFSQKRYANKFFKVAFFSDDRDFIRWVRDAGVREIERLKEKGLENVFLRPWNKDMLRNWCWDLELNLNQSNIEQLMDLTGGFPVFVERFYEALSDREGAVDDAFAVIKSEMYGSNTAIAALKSACGFSSLWPNALGCLNLLAEYQSPVTEEEFRELCAEEFADFKEIFYCLDSLSLIVKDDEGLFLPNPVVRHILALEARGIS